MTVVAMQRSPAGGVRPHAGIDVRSPRRDHRPAPMARAERSPAGDETLLARYRDDRRPEDLGELFRRHSGELRKYLARYLGDDALAEDVLQETFLMVQSKCSLYRDGLPVRPWLYAVAVHRAVDVLRRMRRHDTTSPSMPVREQDETRSTWVEVGVAFESGDRRPPRV